MSHHSEGMTGFAGKSIQGSSATSHRFISQSKQTDPFPVRSVSQTPTLLSAMSSHYSESQKQKKEPDWFIILLVTAGSK